MKSYLFCIRHAGKYYEKVVQADNDQDAKQGLLKAVDQNESFDKEEDEVLYRPDYCFVTCEEVNNGVGAIGNKEAGTGVQMGKPGVEAGQSNT